MNAKRMSSCHGKAVYGSWHAAERVSRMVARRDGRDGAIAPYRCRYCGGIHLGASSEHIKKAQRGPLRARTGAFAGDGDWDTYEAAS